MTDVCIVVPGEAVPFARAGAQGKRRFTPAPQARQMGVVKLFAQRAMEGRPPLTGPIGLEIFAYYPPPESWPAKKKAATIWKTSKPDADNLAKLIKDAIGKIVFVDDAQVAKLMVQKQYGAIAETQIFARELLDRG